MAEKVVLAYSGGLDTSVSIRWIKEKYGLDVVTCTVDIGQREDLSSIGERAKKIGALAHYQIDAKEEFAKDYIFKSVKANGMYQGVYPISTALARPLVAEKAVDVAKKEGAIAVAHGSTGKGNDQVRFDVTIKGLDPSLRIIAPVREWNLSRDEEIKYAIKNNIPVKPSKSIYSTDQNLWGRSIEAGPLEDPYTEPPEDSFEWCVPIKKAPEEPQYIELGFEQGIPTALDGKKLSPVELINQVGFTAGSNGFGIVDHIEDRLVGIKSREVYECPAALTIIAAHKDLEKLVLTREELQFKNKVEEQWSWLVYSGLWIEPLRADLDAFIDSTQKRVTGTVRVKLHKGNMRVIGRKSENALYQHKLSTYDKSSTFDQKAAVGFIDIWGMASRVAAQKAVAAASEGRTNGARKVAPTVKAQPKRKK